MANEYDAESKFLTKNYKAFLHNYITEIRDGREAIHLHPPPAFRRLYELIIHRFVDHEAGEVDSTDLITMMDMVAKFMSYLNRNNIEYDNFSECSCTRISDDDLRILLESGGENR